MKAYSTPPPLIFTFRVFKTLFIVNIFQTTLAMFCLFLPHLSLVQKMLLFLLSSEASPDTLRAVIPFLQYLYNLSVNGKKPIRTKSWDLSSEIELPEQFWCLSLKEGKPSLVLPLVPICGRTQFLHCSFHQNLLSAAQCNNHHWHGRTNKHCREDKKILLPLESLHFAVNNPELVEKALTRQMSSSQWKNSHFILYILLLSFCINKKSNWKYLDIFNITHINFALENFSRF